MNFAAGRFTVELSVLSTISELFDTALENCRDQTQQMPGAPQPPMPQRPCGRRAYKTPAWSDQLGSFHAALGWARSPLTGEWATLLLHTAIRILQSGQKSVLAVLVLIPPACAVK